MINDISLGHLINFSGIPALWNSSIHFLSLSLSSSLHVLIWCWWLRWFLGSGFRVVLRNLRLSLFLLSSSSQFFWSSLGLVSLVARVLKNVLFFPGHKSAWRNPSVWVLYGKGGCKPNGSTVFCHQLPPLPVHYSSRHQTGKYPGMLSFLKPRSFEF